MRDPKDIEIDGKTLETILEEHKHWLNKDCKDWESMHVNLRHADLHDVNLSNIDLKYIDLSYANLKCANLSHADLDSTSLSKANLIEANLHGTRLGNADLQGADLIRANLSEANLIDAYLTGANLSNADLSNAKLCWADLRKVILSWANLNNTDLNYTDLSEANLSCADLSKAKGSLIDFRKGKILTESIIGYKKCENNIIVTLEIPAGAIVFSINGNKCRTNKAKVIAINDKYGKDVCRAISTYQYLSYYVGDEINITNFDLEYNVECGAGIHFFMTREEALKYGKA